MLTFGVDTYVTVEEMTEYINNYYMSDSPYKVNWEKLRSATSQIEKYNYQGEKKNKQQVLKFPRKKFDFYNVAVLIPIPFIPQGYSRYIYDDGYSTDDGLKAAKKCTIAIALERLTYTDVELISSDKIICSAIKSRHVDVISETYNTKSEDTNRSKTIDEIAKTQIRTYLKNWTSTMAWGV